MFYKEGEVKPFGTLRLTDDSEPLNAKKLEWPSSAARCRIRTSTHDAALEYEPFRLQARQRTFELFQVGIRAVDLHAEHISNL